MNAKKKGALGTNPLDENLPLTQGIFTSTAKPTAPEIQESRIKKEESRKKILENPPSNQFLQDSPKEKVNFRLTGEVNDWLDLLIKSGKRKHGHKIPKEIWVQAAVELMKEIDADWSDAASIDELRAKLANVLKRIKKPK